MSALQTVTASRSLDVARIRADFPILSRRVHGKRLVFLDSAASAQKPQAVIDAERHFYETEYANVHRGVYWLSQRATDAYRGGARKGPSPVERARDARNRLRARRDGSDQPGGAELRPHLPLGGRRGAHHPHGASRQHRAVADAARRKGHRAESGADRRCGRTRPGRVRPADRPAHEADRGDACRQRARHRAAGRRRLLALPRRTASPC